LPLVVVFSVLELDEDEESPEEESPADESFDELESEPESFDDESPSEDPDEPAGTDFFFA